MSPGKLFSKRAIRIISYLVIFTSLSLSFPTNSYGQIKKTLKKKKTTTEIQVKKPAIESTQIDRSKMITKESIGFCLESIEKINDTKLFVCNSGNNCQQNLGYVAEELHLPSKDLEKKFTFSWTTKREKLEGIMWQISSKPFDCNTLEQVSGLVKSGKNFQKYTAYGETRGIFEIDFNSLFSFNKKFTHISSTKSIKSNAKIVDAKKMKNIKQKQIDVKFFYIRFIPIVDSKLVYGCSNTIKMRFDDLPPDSDLSLYVPPPRIFPDVYKITQVEFTSFVFPDVKWGSMEILGFDEALYQETLNQSMNKSFIVSQRQKYENAYKHKQLIQPNSYKGKGSDGWLESLWDAARSTVDWVSESYEKAKEKLVDIVGEIIDNLPVIECEGDCKSILQASLETGLVAVGIPPRLPNAEQLIDEGIDYLASEAAYQMGCGELCANEIEKQLEQLGDQLSSHQRQIVGNEAEAHNHGVEPLVIPPWVKARVSPRSMIQMPKIVVEIQRTFEDVPESEQVDLDAYHLAISSVCTNRDYIPGSRVRVPVNTDYREGYRVGEQTEILEFKVSPKAALFSTSTLHLPVLKKGEKIKIPVTLNQSTYLFPGHLEMIRKVGGHIWYDDWTDMYDGGDIKFITSIVSEDLDPISWTTKTKVVRQREDIIFNVSNFEGAFKPAKRIQ